MAGPSCLTAQAIAFMECTWTTTLCGNTACMAVSTEAHLPDGLASVSGMAMFRLRHCLARVRSTEIKKSSASAWINHLPEALIHNEPPIFTEVLPVLA